MVDTELVKTAPCGGGSAEMDEKKEKKKKGCVYYVAFIFQEGLGRVADVNLSWLVSTRSDRKPVGRRARRRQAAAVCLLLCNITDKAQ